jgi:hypothetical protein
MDQMKDLGGALAAGALSSMTGVDASKIQEMINSDSYFEFAKNPSISKSYQWGIACGADLIHLRGEVINDLSAGADRDVCLITLSEQWGINSTDEFIEMAESLKAGRHSKVYRAIAMGQPVPGYDDIADSIEKAKLFFTRDGLIGRSIPNMTIWDLGRLVNISRFAFDASLIDRETALGYVKHVALEVQKEYGSWREVSIGYQFGRAVWGGIDMEYKELKKGMEQLLTEKDSPWVTLPFDIKLEFDEEPAAK